MNYCTKKMNNYAKYANQVQREKTDTPLPLMATQRKTFKKAKSNFSDYQNRQDHLSESVKKIENKIGHFGDITS